MMIETTIAKVIRFCDRFFVKDTCQVVHLIVNTIETKDEYF